MNKAQLILNESMDAYHANDCVSNSKLAVLEDGGPALYYGRFVSKTIPHPPATEALILGCAFDTLITESREKFNACYVLKPEGMNFTTKEGKQWKLDHCPDESKLVTWAQWQMFQKMEEALKSDPLFSSIIHSQMIAQATVRIPSTKFGVGVQSKPDWLSRVPCEFSHGKPYSVNLKTTLDFGDWFNDADPQSPQTGKPVYTHGYHRQAALDQWGLFYCEEIGETAHFLLVIEKKEPYRVGWVELDDPYLEAGWTEAIIGFRRLQHCYTTGVWPKTLGGIRSLSPPKWLLDRSLRLNEEGTP